MKKILFFLSTEKGYTVLSSLLKENDRPHIGGVVSFPEKGVLKDWSRDIQKTCEGAGIPFCFWADIREKIPQLIKELSITGIIAIGWRYLLPLSLNSLLEDDIVIFHDSLLPAYRGFAPVATAMLCGETEIGASALFAVEKADRGDIIAQMSFHLDPSMYMEDVIKKMSGLYAAMASEVLRKMIDGNLKGVPQDERKATYSIWRDEEDYWIDWRHTAEEIRTQIRALGYPYPGSKTRCGEDLIRIQKATVLDHDLNFAIRQPGKLWELVDKKPVVVCGKGLLRIDDARYEDGKEYRFSQLRRRLRGKNDE